jgi:2-dehydropantoate 2-reductase
MKILMYGAGVLGSLYGARLKESGHDVTVLERGNRFDEIKSQGIVLEHALTGKRTITGVTVTDELKPDDFYDIIFVVMRRNHVENVLPILAANNSSPLIVFMVSNPNGYKEWIQAVGRKRLLIGFAGAGGNVVNGVVRYHVVTPILQPTTFGEPERGITERVKRLANEFKRAGFPTAVCSDMESWQKSHSAWVGPMANSLYMVGGSGVALANRPAVILLLIQAIRESYSVLRALGFPITPAKLKAFELIPAPILVSILRMWARTKHFDTVATQHTLSGFDEMSVLSNDFQLLARSTNVPTPALDKLHASLADWKGIPQDTQHIHIKS